MCVRVSARTFAHLLVGEHAENALGWPLALVPREGRLLRRTHFRKVELN